MALNASKTIKPKPARQKPVPKPAAKKAAATKASTSKAKAQPRRASAARPGNSGEQAPNASPVVEIPHDQIAPSPLNPRKTIDEAYVTELAASVLAKGQLQNISVRPVTQQPDAPALHKQGAGAEHNEKIKYQIVFGEQRWRAIAQLVAEGHLPPDTPVLARVLPIDDAEHLELAIMENQDRAEIHPLEQAEAYARLAALREGEAGADAPAVTALIAQRTGQTVRNIQYQLQVARNLTDATKQAWNDGRIGTRKLAIAIARQPAKTQAAIIEAMEWDPIRSPAELSQWLAHDCLPAASALFDLGAYHSAGGTLAHDPETDAPLIDDRELFLKLQGAALARKAESVSLALGLTKAPVKVNWYERTRGTLLIRDDPDPERVNTDAIPAGAYVEYAMASHDGEIHLALVAPADASPAQRAAAKKAAGTAPDTPAVQPLARRNWLAGGTARTRVIRDAIRAHPAYALAVAIVALLPKRSSWDADLCAVRTEWPTGDSAKAREDTPDIWPEILTGLPGFSLAEITDRETAMISLLALTQAELLSLFAHLIANRCSDVPFTAQPGAKPESRVIAGHTNTGDDSASETALAGLCTEDWMKAYTMPQLQALAHDSGAAKAMAEAGKPLAANKAYLVSTLPQFIPGYYVPPEARFLDPDAAQRAVDAMLAKGGEA